MRVIYELNGKSGIYLIFLWIYFCEILLEYIPLITLRLFGEFR